MLPARIKLDYTNVPNNAAKPQPDYMTVRATLNVEVDSTQWAGTGASAPIYQEFPTGPQGAQSYQKTIRYAQGVTFVFKGHGMVYKLNLVYLINALLGTVVLFSVAATVTGIVSKYFWFTSRMIRNKAVEKLAVGRRLAELGLKASSYAAIFNKIDEDRNGEIRASDILRELAKTGDDMTSEQAAAIAYLVISRSQDDRDEHAGDKSSISFAEYMQAMEGNYMIPFDEFKCMVTKFCKRRGYQSNPTMMRDNTMAVDVFQHHVKDFALGCKQAAAKAGEGLASMAKGGEAAIAKVVPITSDGTAVEEA